MLIVSFVPAEGKTLAKFCFLSPSHCYGRQRKLRIYFVAFGGYAVLPGRIEQSVLGTLNSRSIEALSALRWLWRKSAHGKVEKN